MGLHMWTEFAWVKFCQLSLYSSHHIFIEPLENPAIHFDAKTSTVLF